MERKECGAAPRRLDAAGRHDLVLLTHTHTHTAQLLDAHAASHCYTYTSTLPWTPVLREGEERGGKGGEREGNQRGGAWNAQPG